MFIFYKCGAGNGAREGVCGCIIQIYRIPRKDGKKPARRKLVRGRGRAVGEMAGNGAEVAGNGAEVAGQGSGGNGWE